MESIISKKRIVDSSEQIGQLIISIATAEERELIYQLRHDVYAKELNQHPPNLKRRLTDKLDKFNIYIVAKADGRLAGFISITTPECQGYSIDKYFSRDILPFDFNNGLYEIRLLTVTAPFRGTLIAGLLMYAAFRWIEENGGTRVIAIGRREVLNLYLKVGLKSLNRHTKAGAVTYELLSETTANMGDYSSKCRKYLERLREKAHWQIDIPFYSQSA